MSNNQPIAKLPASKWQPLIELIAECIKMVDEQTISDFALTFEVKGFATEPYIQVSLNEDGDFVFEITSSNFLEPGLSPIQQRVIESVGWSSPRKTNPNYSKIFDRNYSPISMATYTLTVFRMTFDVPIATTMSLSPAELIELVQRRTDFKMLDESRFSLAII